ncbi:MAG TPA: phytanoyl-CoA dioxygenase family protein [Pseudonocardiaceae bacterium]|jgi:hypothetical protein|nr:phytanoyl-CoA dioxygenase family protein [Pseudonocardiaceae bacterium]
MDELPDASAVIGTPAALHARLAADGYLFFRRLLNLDAVGAAGAAVAEVLRRHGAIRADGRPRRRALACTDRRYWSVYRDLQALEAVHRLPFDPALGHLMRALAGERVFVHPCRIIRTVWPTALGGPGTPNVHRDYPNWRIPDMFTTWIPFQRCPPERGGLCVLTGSHRHGLAGPQSLSLAEPGWATTDYQPGDVLVCHAYTVHAAPPNRTDMVRLSADYRWHDARTRTPHWTLLPDGNIGDWAALTAGWTQTNWVTPPPDVVSFPDDTELPELTELPPSRLLATWPAARATGPGRR